MYVKTFFSVSSNYFRKSFRNFAYQIVHISINQVVSIFIDQVMHIFTYQAVNTFIHQVVHIFINQERGNELLISVAFEKSLGTSMVTGNMAASNRFFIPEVEELFASVLSVSHPVRQFSGEE